MLAEHSGAAKAVQFAGDEEADRQVSQSVIQVSQLSERESWPGRNPFDSITLPASCHAIVGGGGERIAR